MALLFTYDFSQVADTTDACMIIFCINNFHKLFAAFVANNSANIVFLVLN